MHERIPYGPPMTNDRSGRAPLRWGRVARSIGLQGALALVAFGVAILLGRSRR